MADCDSLPIRKRYLRAGHFAADPSIVGSVVDSQATTDTSLDQNMTISVGSSRLPLAVEPPCLRAGVIRHSSNPHRCLEVYYIPKNC
jgi:hypothetical protein